MSQRRLSMESIIACGKDQAAAELAGEVLILSLQTGAYYGLSDVGARIWDLLGTSPRVSELCARIVSEYDVEPDRCSRDVLALLQALVDRGLVEVRGEGTPQAR